MKYAFSDDSGDSGYATPSSAASNLLVNAGFVVDSRTLPALEEDVLTWKRESSQRARRLGDAELRAYENGLKGGDLRAGLRRAIRRGERAERRRYLRRLSAILDVLERRDARVFGVCVVKQNGRDGHSKKTLFADSLEKMAIALQRDLTAAGATCKLTIDARKQSDDVARSKQRFSELHGQLVGVGYVEEPIFVGSTRSLGVQLADIVTSALVTPIVAWCRLEPSDDWYFEEYEQFARLFRDRVGALTRGYSGASLLTVDDQRTGEQLTWAKM